MTKDTFLYIDLPTFPKGTLSLGPPQLAAYLNEDFDFCYHSCDLSSEDNLISIISNQKTKLVGLKVSSQNFQIACELTNTVRKINPTCKIVWGGEFPTLMPGLSKNHADVIVVGMFDYVAKQFIHDYYHYDLKTEYRGETLGYTSDYRSPDLSIYDPIKAFNRFIGLPLETSRGCTEVCTFCMVHTMQAKHYHLKPLHFIKSEIEAIGKNIINIIDYNFGVSKQHVTDVCKIIEQSKSIGFMAEMCIELLDDDEVLIALGKARCKMIYCGLETIEETALKAVHKMNTNKISNYSRIIAKARKFGVNVASGFILGIDGTTQSTFDKSIHFFNENGLAYVKFTYLTYNPGTKAKKYYEKKGKFVTDNLTHYDGNHVTYLPSGVQLEVIRKGTVYTISQIYGWKSVIKRSFICGRTTREKIAYALFNWCYSQVYHNWIVRGQPISDQQFDKVLKSKYKQLFPFRLAQYLLLKIWEF